MHLQAARASASGAHQQIQKQKEKIAELNKRIQTLTDELSGSELQLESAIAGRKELSNTLKTMEQARTVMIEQKNEAERQLAAVQGELQQLQAQLQEKAEQLGTALAVSGCRAGLHMLTHLRVSPHALRQQRTCGGLLSQLRT